MSAARGSVSSGAGTLGHRTFRSLYFILYFLRGAKRVARQITFRPLGSPKEEAPSTRLTAYPSRGRSSS
jgi:hypothetical protein